MALYSSTKWTTVVVLKTRVNSEVIWINKSCSVVQAPGVSPYTLWSVQSLSDYCCVMLCRALFLFMVAAVAQEIERPLTRRSVIRSSGRRWMWCSEVLWVVTKSCCTNTDHWPRHMTHLYSLLLECFRFWIKLLIVLPCMEACVPLFIVVVNKKEEEEEDKGPQPMTSVPAAGSEHIET